MNEVQRDDIIDLMNENTKLKARNEKLVKVAEAAEPFSGDAIPRGQDWARLKTRLFDALKDLEAPK